MDPFLPVFLFLFAVYECFVRLLVYQYFLSLLKLIKVKFFHEMIIFQDGAKIVAGKRVGNDFTGQASA